MPGGAFIGGTSGYATYDGAPKIPKYTHFVYYKPMKNITITLDDETATWARTSAARQNKSLSRFLGELLETTMHESHAYDEAMRRYLAKKPGPIAGYETTYPERHALHERHDLR